MGSVQKAERGYFDRDPNEKISVASIKRRVEKLQSGLSVLDEEEWKFVLEKILPKVGSVVLIKNLPGRIEDVLRIRRGEGTVPAKLQHTYIYGKFRTTASRNEAAIARVNK